MAYSKAIPPHIPRKQFGHSSGGKIKNLHNHYLRSNIHQSTSNPVRNLQRKVKVVYFKPKVAG